jgi:hypothetical protein
MLKYQTPILRTVLGGLLSLGSLLAIASPATASFLRDGWMYAIDPSDDSYASINGVPTVGNTIYEIYGIAIHEDLENNRIWVAFNSNLSIEGRPETEIFFPGETQHEEVPGDSVMWGDLFFDFNVQQSFQEANESSTLFGVRFSNHTNGALEIGVYENVSGIGVGPENAGFSTLESYNRSVRGISGQDTWMGSLPWNSPYFGHYSQPFDPSLGNDPEIENEPRRGNRMPNIIGSGNLISNEVTIHTREELEAQGFSLEHFYQEGSEVFGISFVRPIGFVGDFIATIMHECLNDGISLLGTFSNPEETEDPPEPDDPSDDPPDSPGDPIPPVSISIPLLEDCPVSPGQRYALQPSRIENGVKIIDNPISGAWYDPPPYADYQIRAGNGALITEIVSFPCGVIGRFMYGEDTWTYISEEFEVVVDNIRLPQRFRPGEGIQFEQFKELLGDRLTVGENGRLGVSEFVIEGIREIVCVGDISDTSVCQPPSEPINPPPHVSYECDNSGEATSFCVQLLFDRERVSYVEIGPKEVPEPATILGTIAFGGVLAKLARSRHQKR